MNKNSSPDTTNKLSNEEVLEALGLSEYFEKIDSKLLKKRICMGITRILRIIVPYL